MRCRCEVKVAREGLLGAYEDSAFVIYCPLHAAAEELLELVEFTLDYLVSPAPDAADAVMREHDQLVARCKAAIAKVKSQ